MKTAKLIGSAGTGKTHRLMLTLDRLLAAGIDPLSVGFVTFTRAARREAVMRASDRLAVPPAKLEKKGWFRTLHSCCYRLLGVDGELLTDTAVSRAWVTNALDEPVEALDGDIQDDGWKPEAKTDADKALSLWSTARNRLEPFEVVYHEARTLDSRLPPLAQCEAIIGRYEEAKRDDDRCDFTDLLLRVAGYRCWTEGVERTEPEGEPPELEAWILDEAQDLSKLSYSVFARFIHTGRCRFAYEAGDPYQAIFGFAGSDPKHFRDFPSDKTEIMPRSYRCPAPILALGESILSECSDYFDRHVAPATHDGEIIERDVRELAGEVDPRQDWLVLARSNRLVASLCRQLDDAGIPWAPTRGKGGWAPSIRTTAIQTLAAMQRGEPIKARDWVDVVKTLPATGRLVRGTKQHWTKNLNAERLRAMPPVTIEEWPALGLTDEYAAKIRAGAWTDDISKAAAYCEAVKSYGQATVDKPGIRVSTIHGAKGAEAENVALLTTLPYPSAMTLGHDDLRDAENRCWYVGATRARRKLMLVNDPQSRFKKRL